MWNQPDKNALFSRGGTADPSAPQLRTGMSMSGGEYGPFDKQHFYAEQDNGNEQ